MARRKLEAALEAGKYIKENPDPWGIEKLSSYTYPDFKNSVYCLALGGLESEIIAGFGDGCLQRLEICKDDVSCKAQGKAGMPGGFPITTVRLVPFNSNQALAATADGKIYFWDTEMSNAKEVVDERQNEINTLDISIDGTSYATAGADHTIRIYDLRTNKCIRTFEGYGTDQTDILTNAHASRVFALRYNPQHPAVFVTGGWDNHIKVWDSRLVDPVVTLMSGPHICGDAIDIRGDLLVTGSWVRSNALQLWSMTYHKLLTDLPLEPGQDGEYIYSCRFCSNNTVVAGGSGTRNVQLVDVSQPKVLGQVSFGNRVVNALDVSKDGTLVAYGGSGHKLNVAQTLTK